MNLSFDFEKAFMELFPLETAATRFKESREVAQRISAEGVQLMPNMDHTAMMSDPPRLVTGPLGTVGYRPGWDDRSYPSPVEGHEFWLISCKLPEATPMRARGWFEYVASVWPINDDASHYFVGQGNGNPFLHHMTMGIVPLERGATEDDLAYALRLVPYMAKVHAQIEQGTGEQASQFIMSLPDQVFDNERFRERLPELMRDLGDTSYMMERMQGGGFLIQFFVLAGARIEVACRYRTTQAFNPRSTERFTRDEISIRKDVLAKAIATKP